MGERLSKAGAVDRIVSDLTALRRRTSNFHAVRAAVVGPSASGKDHLIEQIVTRLKGASVLNLDDYYRGRAWMAANGVGHYDDPNALDLGEAARHLARARTRRAFDRPIYDFPSGERVGVRAFEPSSIVLVNGLFALCDPELRAQIDYAAFIDTDHYSAMLRRLFRDAGPNGRTKQTSREVLRQYFTTVWPAKKRFIDPTAEHADVIIESRYDAASEAHRAGPVQCQLKIRGWRDDDALRALVGAQRIGGTVTQADRFLAPRDRDAAGEMLRLRWENGGLFLTYKGPHLPGDGSALMRPVSAAIELEFGDARWFSDDYRTLSTIKKKRVLFECGGIVLARDQVDRIGPCFEARTNDPAQSGRLREVLAKLRLGSEMLTESYFDLYQRAGQDSLSI